LILRGSRQFVAFTPAEIRLEKEKRSIIKKVDFLSFLVNNFLKFKSSGDEVRH